MSPSAQPWRIVADAAPHLIGQYTSRGSGLVLVGARTTYLDVDVAGRGFTVGVRLRPGVLPLLFDVAADELTDRSVLLADVLGCAPAETSDALAAEDAPATVRSLITFLADRARASKPIDERITKLVQAATGEPATVRDAAEAVALSERTVRYWSQQQVGMGMKRLWRIRRRGIFSEFVPVFEAQWNPYLYGEATMDEAVLAIMRALGETTEE